MPSSGTPHVAILAFPFGTHAAPLYSLARLLASAAPHALFSFIGSTKSNAPLAQIPSPGNLSLYAVSDGCPEGFYSPNPEDEVELFLKVSPGNFVEGMESAVRKHGGVPVSCVVSDCFLWFAGELAESLAVPWVPLWTGGTCSLSAHVYTDEIRHRVGAGDEAIANKLDDTVEILPAVRVRDLPEGVVSGNLQSAFSLLIHRMGLELPRAAAVALNTFHALESPVIADLSTKLTRCLPIGPLNLVADQPPIADASGCLSWLDGHPSSSVVYIAFGTLLCPPPSELAALAEALEESGVPFLWSLREKAQMGLPKGFVERTTGQGKVVAWAPQNAVLRHAAVGAFVTHCGWNSVTEGVAGGVPMICRPFFGDQRINARQVAHLWGVGVAEEGGVLTKEGVVAALRKVLGSEEGRRMREKAKEIGKRAAEAVAEGGSSAKSLGDLVKIVCGGI